MKLLTKEIESNIPALYARRKLRLRIKSLSASSLPWVVVGPGTWLKGNV
jgi:hypothetical protein